MANPPRRRPRSPGGPVSDIERFLMEVERLRKKAADEQPVDDVQIVDDVEVVRPAPPPPPPPRRVIRPRPVESVDVQQVMEVVPVRPAPSPERAAPPAAPRIATFRTGPPGGLIAQQVVAMLHSRQQMRAAIILGEVLGPPACRRRR